MFHKILTALDNSELGQHVFVEAVSLAKATDAHLLLLHVMVPFAEGYPDPVYPVVDSIYSTDYIESLNIYMQQWQAIEQTGLEFLHKHTATATMAGVSTEFSQKIGYPGSVICDTAQTWGADLIILGHRERSRLGELILGSISNYVFHHASCSVLMVHTQAHPGSQAASEDITVLESKQMSHLGKM